MAKSIYYQIQYDEKAVKDDLPLVKSGDLVNVHSDGCFKESNKEEFKKFLHDSLDEFLEHSMNQEENNNILKGAHFIVAPHNH